MWEEFWTEYRKPIGYLLIPFGVAMGLVFFKSSPPSEGYQPQADRVQEWIMKGDIARALEFRAPLGHELSPYAAYRDATDAILRGSFQEALEMAVTLRESLRENPETTPYLWSRNLLRIALLQRTVGNMPGEEVAWQEYEKAPLRESF